MNIHAPRPTYSDTEREIIQHICNQILSNAGNSDNYPEGSKVLTDLEADKLVELLTAYLKSDRFNDINLIGESVLGDDPFGNDSARLLYFRRKDAYGKPTVYTRAKWADLLERVGLGSFGYTSKTSAMSFQHFVEMECKLLSYYQISPATFQIMRTFILRSRSAYSQIQARKIRPRGMLKKSIRENVIDPVSKGLLEVPTAKLAAVAYIVADGTVQFTTRDWSAVSIISGYAASLATLSR